MFMMIDVIKIFDFNFIIVNSKDSDSDSKNSKNLKNSENLQNSVDFKKFKGLLDQKPPRGAARTMLFYESS